MLKQFIFASIIGLASLAQASSFHDLAFLRGCWRGSDDQSLNEECWGSTDGNLMLGTSKSIVADQVASFEFLKISKTDDGIVYTPTVNGQETVSFPLKSATAHSAEFENLTHDFPRLMRYELKSETLAITLAGIGATGEPTEITYSLRKQTGF